MSANPTNSQTLQPPKLLDQLRGKTRLLRSSKRTEDAAVDWATKFIVFHGRPQEVASGISQGVCPLSESKNRRERNTDCHSFAGNIPVTPLFGAFLTAAGD